MALYRSSSINLPSGPRVGAGIGAGAGVGVQETTSVLLLPVRVPLASSSLPEGEGLRQTNGPAI